MFGKNSTMKSQFQTILWILFLLFGLFSSAQNKQEREHRIKKTQFPGEALQIIAQNNTDFKRLKFYREVDSIKKIYIAKFKKARLFYEMDFNEKGEFTGMGFAIKPVDIPEESFKRMTECLSEKFEKSKVRKMFQVYELPQNEDMETTMKNAFQNLMIPNMTYELFVKGKKDGVRADFEITFDSKGNFVHIKNALPPNYDRVLY